MMQTKRQKQRKENSIQDTRARTNPILSWVVDIKILLFLYLEPICQLAQDLYKAGLSSNRCFVEPDVELVDGVFKPLLCILITIQKQIIFISAKWDECVAMSGSILTFISGVKFFNWDHGLYPICPIKSIKKLFVFFMKKKLYAIGQTYWDVVCPINPIRFQKNISFLLAIVNIQIT